MKQELFTVSENTPLAPGVFRLRLNGDTSDLTRPGQFVNVAIDGLYLRRPISVCDKNEDMLTLLIKEAGTGTHRLAAAKKGDRLDLLTGLGNGFDTSKSGEMSLVIGGGIGIAPLYLLTRELRGKNTAVTAILGFNNGSEIFYAEEFAKLGAKVIITTIDGSRGVKGYVTAGMSGLDYDYFYACGPDPMLKAVDNAATTSGQFSFEERMGCGFGACMGCSCKTKYGARRICKDGPVLTREEIIW